MKWFSVIVAVLLALSGARAEGPDDQYIRIYTLIQEADKLNSSGQPSEALPKYLEAQTALQRFQAGYPDWNVRVIKFRVSYVAGKIAAMSARVPAPAPASTGAMHAAPPKAGPTQPAQPAAPSDWEAQLAALKEQARQLQADKAILEAKLKEALAVQPAALDPRELARAEEKIKGLMKENDLLKVTLDRQKGQPLPATDAKALEEARQGLAEANLKVAEQTKTANALALEKAALQAKLNNPAPSSSNAADLEATKKALDDTNRKLADQSKLASDLASEKEALQNRLKSLSADAEAAAALRAENDILKKQVADLKAAPPSAADTNAASSQLAQAQAQDGRVAVGQGNAPLEKTTLENRVKQLSTPPRPRPPTPAQAKAADATRIKQLERERSETCRSSSRCQQGTLQPQEQGGGSQGGGPGESIGHAARPAGSVRGAASALYRRGIGLVQAAGSQTRPPADHKGGKKSVKELPPAPWRSWRRRTAYYAEQAVRQGRGKIPARCCSRTKQNVPTLANLAAIELDLGHFEAAEINIKQAIGFGAR
jgi:hypothetical protein